MLRFYEIYCESSTKEEDRRCFRVIKAKYIDEPAMSSLEIAEKEFVDRRTVDRDIQAACQALSVLIFGIDGLDCV